MKKVSALTAAAVLAVCSVNVPVFSESMVEAPAESLQIVTTIFPEYDWVNEILGDNPAGIEVTMLLDSGVDLHSFEPTAEDIMKVSNCDMFVYVGGESDEWVEDVLNAAANPDMQVINLVEVMGDEIKMEEIVEGMEHDHEHEHEDEEHEEGEEEHEHEDEDHEDGEEHEHDHEHEEEADEHVWLSLRNAQKLAQAISDAICELDPANAETYSANTEAYLAELAAMDQEYEETLSVKEFSTVLFGDRFPFRYLTDDYGLDYFAAFSGCSAETEASFETIIFLAQKVDELDLPCVLTIEGPDHKIAETVIGSTKDQDQEILTLDSMQSVTAEDVEAGADYLEIMKANLDVLKAACEIE